MQTQKKEYGIFKSFISLFSEHRPYHYVAEPALKRDKNIKAQEPKNITCLNNSIYLKLNH